MRSALFFSFSPCPLYFFSGMGGPSMSFVSMCAQSHNAKRASFVSSLRLLLFPFVFPLRAGQPHHELRVHVRVRPPDKARHPHQGRHPPLRPPLQPLQALRLGPGASPVEVGGRPQVHHFYSTLLIAHFLSLDPLSLQVLPLGLRASPVEASGTPLMHRFNTTHCPIAQFSCVKPLAHCVWARTSGGVRWTHSALTLNVSYSCEWYTNAALALAVSQLQLLFLLVWFNLGITVVTLI